VRKLFIYRNPDIKGEKGPASALHIADVPRPEAKKGDAIVKIKAFGLNRMDLLQREGNYPVPPGASKILGVEFSGTVDSINGESGEETNGFKVGDEVFGLAYGGEISFRSLYCHFDETARARNFKYRAWDCLTLTFTLGAYAEYIAVSTKMLLHKPKELSWEVASGIPEVCLFLSSDITHNIRHG
jgi:NADPH:quinone reductase-like Zn-dependent oxidoreductase